jgi:hypothetical protein
MLLPKTLISDLRRGGLKRYLRRSFSDSLYPYLLFSYDWPWTMVSGLFAGLFFFGRNSSGISSSKYVTYSSLLYATTPFVACMCTSTVMPGSYSELCPQKSRYAVGSFGILRLRRLSLRIYFYSLLSTFCYSFAHVVVFTINLPCT